MTRNALNKECEARVKVAEEIASKCSCEYGREIIIVGSVSRGLADENSDIEIEFLVENSILQQDRVNLIKEIGGTEIFPYGAPIGDGSEWIIFKYKGYWIEAGWQKVDTMKKNIEEILDGKVYEHDKLVLASAFRDAIFIRKNGELSSLQDKLIYYPTSLQKRIIMDTISPWTIDLAIDVRKMLSKRNDKLPLLERMIPDVKRILRVLYAINKQWEPDWKWMDHITSTLRTKPKDLKERIDSILCMNNSEESLKLCFELVKETLRMIPQDLELDDVVNKIIKNIN